MGAVALIVLFLLTQATGYEAVYESYYAWFLGLNIVLAVFLALVLCWMGVRLIIRWRQGKFGSRLLLKLAGIFALVGVLPGLLIYVVSYQFVGRSIESWFDVQMESALDAGVTLAGTTLDVLAADLAHNARSAAVDLELATVGSARAAVQLERLREQLGASSAVLWNTAASGIIASASAPSSDWLPPPRPSPAQLRAAATSARALTSIEGLDALSDDAALPAPETTQTPDGSFAGFSLGSPQVSVHMLAAIHPSRLELLAGPRFLQIVAPLPAALVQNALAVQRAQRAYQERALAREGLRRMYIGALTLSLFLAIFAAVLLAVILGNQLAHPLLVLARGMKDVSQGDLRPKTVVQTRDELGELTRTFALMTQQVLDARTAAEHNMASAKSARARLQTILNNLTAGVLVFDANWKIVSTNLGAGRILDINTQTFLEADIQSWPDIQSLIALAQKQFPLLSQESHQNSALSSATAPSWQEVLEISRADNAKLTLVVRGARLPTADNVQQYLVVFDDISAIVSAQRTQAWAEVARRVAHEIKNPLTPIQLAAQRLELKLGDKLEGADKALLAKSVKTIVEQVGAMLRLVNDFRDYARLPAAELKPLDLNALVADIVSLYPSADKLPEKIADNAGAHIPVLAHLDTHAPPVLADAQQLRQVIHNLLQNAQDATAAHWQELAAATQADSTKPTALQTPEGSFATFSAGSGDMPPEAEPRAFWVGIHTQWDEAAQRVVLSVRDRGAGFAEHILQRAFEPYVTTKARGTGLGLAVVKKIADEHHAPITLGNRSGGGAQVSLSLPACGT